MSKTSKLIRDLSSVPGIISNLGLGIVESQKALNVDYLERLEYLARLISAIANNPMGGDGEPLSDEEKARLDGVFPFVIQTLKDMAPPRYQFTETTLTVAMDLAQSLQLQFSGSFGANLGATTVGASMSMGYGTEYKAAAQVKTVIHAVPGGANVEKLLDRASQVNTKVLAMPAGSKIESQFSEQSFSLLSSLVGKDLKAPETPAET